MVSTYTTNKRLEKPGNGDYVDTWNVPVNSDLDVIDQALGGVTSLNATSGDATLTSTQYRSLIIAISGSMSANVTYTIPSGVGGQWVVRNTTTGGTYTVTFASAGGGDSVEVSRNVNTQIWSDGTSIRTMGVSGGTIGSNTQVIYNNSGNLTGSANLTFNGSTLSAVSLEASNSVSDAIGNLRNVPPNVQTSAYVLQASDNGKVVSITTGGVTVPNSVFSTGNTINIYNNSSSPQTITSASGVTLVQAGTGNTGDRTLGGYGLVAVVCLASNSFVITGSGLT